MDESRRGKDGSLRVAGVLVKDSLSEQAMVCSAKPVAANLALVNLSMFMIALYNNLTEDSGAMLLHATSDRWGSKLRDRCTCIWKTV